MWLGINIIFWQLPVDKDTKPNSYYKKLSMTYTEFIDKLCFLILELA